MTILETVLIYLTPFTLIGLAVTWRAMRVIVRIGTGPGADRGSG